MNEVIIEQIKLNVSDGTIMSAFVARPKDSGKHPAIMVFQEAFGVNAHIREVTERFAKEGFIAIAPELFHRTGKDFEGSYEDFEGTRKHTSALTNEGLIADIKASYEWLRNEGQVIPDEITSIGFCMGGRVSVLANTSVKLKAAVSLYGGGMLTILERVTSMQAPQLLIWGGLDKHIDSGQINTITTALTENNKEYVNVVFSYAGHGFFCNARSSYNPIAANQAWALSLAFLNSYIKKN
jgi:carboxymethylenebutenolidase